MLPTFLVPESVIREDGAGPAVGIGPSEGKLLLLTLGITRIIEQESLDISIWGSPDGTAWGTKALASFPQKFYCGTYQIVVDFSAYEDIKYLQARWKVNRWGHGEAKPLFGIYVFGQETERRAIAKTA